MALDDTQKQQLVAFMNRTRKNHQCPRCHENNWAIDAIVQVAIQDVVGPMMFGGPVLPLAVLSCRVCAHTEFINLVLAGITPRVGG